MGGKAGWEPCVAKDNIQLIEKGYFGLSAANRKDTAGDRHEVSSFMMWDLKKKYDQETASEAEETATWKKEDSQQKETHELVHAVKSKGKDLQDELLENLSDQVQRDRTFKIKEFGDMHSNLNEALQTISMPTHLLLDLSTSIQSLQTSFNLAKAELSQTRQTLEQDSGSSAQKQDVATLNSYIADLQSIKSTLQKRDGQHHASSEQMLMYKQQVTKTMSKQEGGGYLWPIVMFFQAVVVVVLFVKKPKENKSQYNGGLCV
jgi:hypothetical protein